MGTVWVWDLQSSVDMFPSRHCEWHHVPWRSYNSEQQHHLSPCSIRREEEAGTWSKHQKQIMSILAALTTSGLWQTTNYLWPDKITVPHVAVLKIAGRCFPNIFSLNLKDCYVRLFVSYFSSRLWARHEAYESLNLLCWYNPESGFFLTPVPASGREAGLLTVDVRSDSEARHPTSGWPWPAWFHVAISLMFNKGGI